MEPGPALWHLRGIMIAIGALAPDFDAPASGGKNFKLSDHLGRYVVLFFYPGAFTPGCTAESKRFRDNSPEIESLGADVVGISADSLKTQCDFADSIRVKFPLVSDEGAKIARAYGVKWPILEKPRRVTLIIGPTGKVEAIFKHEIQVLKHVDDVVGFLKDKTAKDKSV